MAKPRVITSAVANGYADGDERIIEFSNGARSTTTHKGGLISFRNNPDGELHVAVYRTDPGVVVTGAAVNHPELARLMAEAASVLVGAPGTDAHQTLSRLVDAWERAKSN